ncbi:unnamed protein product [Rotaria sp. Silwood2]|nr:unnamed protein product [Rotaria sp. Silwood2]
MLKDTTNECLEINKYTIQAVCLMMTKSSDQQYEGIIQQISNIPIVERQSTIDKIFSTYTPLIDELTSKIVAITKQMQICILTEIGKAVMKKIPQFPDYNIILQEGTNAFGGVAFLIHKSIKYKIVTRELNFLLIEIETIPEPTCVGAVYVPPGSTPPFQFFTKCSNKAFCIFGDFNAKHTDWGCEGNNGSGNQIVSWLELTGNEMIIPDKPTSRRSKSIIDFGLTHDATGWHTEVIEDGTSDHLPILLQSPLCVPLSAVFKKTNWKIFIFFLKTVYEYWLSLVYNYDEQFFFIQFSEFLASLWDRCSTYESARRYRPPWPPHLVALAREVKALFIDERSQLTQQKYESKREWILKDQNIWNFVRPTFHSLSPPFRGLTVNSGIMKNPKDIVDTLANHYERHFAEPTPDMNNVIQQKYISIYDKIALLPNIPLDPIPINEVIKEWRKMSSKKSTDSVGTSAFLLKKLPEQYLNIMTVLFNKCSDKGDFFLAAKHAKLICIPKEVRLYSIGNDYDDNSDTDAVFAEK